MNAAFAYMGEAQKILEKLRATQMDTIDQAAEICTHTIANDGVVNLFGTGHSRMFVEEMFPRHGSFPGFHSMVELSLTFHNQVVGSNGQRQAMFLEKVEGLSKMIMRNFVFSAPDSFLIFSNSGVNQVIVEMALEKWGPPVYVRHEIVHNKFVVDGLRDKGAVFVEELSDCPDDRLSAVSSRIGVIAQY